MSDPNDFNDEAMIYHAVNDPVITHANTVSMVSPRQFSQARWVGIGGQCGDGFYNPAGYFFIECDQLFLG